MAEQRTFATPGRADISDPGALDRLYAAQLWARGDRARCLASLDDLFRHGRVPNPLPGGRYSGKLLVLDIAPVFTQLADAVAVRWMPWKGKGFDAGHSMGYNICSRDSLPIARLFWPSYRGYWQDSPGRYRAFPFRTYVAPGLMDPDRQVLKLDYDLPTNPGPSVRRVLDEIVELAEGQYLGKAHLRWWWGRWQTVAFFSLRQE